MSTKLIADSGSTKTRWAYMMPGNGPEIFVTSGINPVTMRHGEIADLLERDVAPNIANRSIDEIFFYGAGCGSEKICSEMTEMLASVTGCQEIKVESDLLGAARALCGHTQGIACILGTGSNSCLFDGKKIVEHVSPLGFILGDEGSGAVIGRTLLGNILKRQLPEKINEAFSNAYGLSAIEVIDRVYRQPMPNKFLASLMPFVASHIAHPAIEEMVVEQFRQFFKRNVMNYTDVKNRPIHFTGSVAHIFSAQLRNAAQSMSLNIASITADPLPQLLKYHEER